LNRALTIWIWFMSSPTATSIKIVYVQSFCRRMCNAWGTKLRRFISLTAGLFNNASPTTYVTKPRMKWREELVRIWREVIVAAFKIPFFSAYLKTLPLKHWIQRRMRAVLVNYEFRMWKGSVLVHFKVHSQHKPWSSKENHDLSFRIGDLELQNTKQTWQSLYSDLWLLQLWLLIQGATRYN
jgi:hypothetical protein